MSYSFSVKAASKSEAKAAIASELARVVEGQPSHQADQAQAQAAADSFIDILADDSSRDISVSMHGSLSWMSSHPETYTGVGVNISASLVAK